MGEKKKTGFPAAGVGDAGKSVCQEILAFFSVTDYTVLG